MIKNSVKSTSPHNYSLTTFTVGESGLEESGVLTIDLVRGSKVEDENILPKQDGVLTEQLLWIAQNYLTEVNVGEMRTRESSVAITKIQEALMWLNKRAEDRKARQVQNTYNK